MTRFKPRTSGARSDLATTILWLQIICKIEALGNPPPHERINPENNPALFSTCFNRFIVYNGRRFRLNRCTLSNNNAPVLVLVLVTVEVGEGVSKFATSSSGDEFENCFK